MRYLSVPRLELQVAVMAVRLKEQIVKEHGMKITSCSFWSDSTTVLQWIHSFHRRQQLFVANRVVEILDTTDVSQWKHVSGINNPADIGTRAIDVEELKRSEWPTWLVWLKRPESEWPEQVNLILASDEENIPSSAFMIQVMIQAEEKKELQAQKMLESTTKFTGERYEVGMLWSETEPNLSNNYSSALGQLYSLERRFRRDRNLKSLYQQSIDTDVERGFVNILDKSEVKGTFGKDHTIQC